MRKIIANVNVSLDGVMQAPGRPEEDRRGGFSHGGWSAPYFDKVMAESAGEGMARPHALLFGRRTYEDFYSVWPKRTDNMFTGVLNRSLKYVVSTTLTQPLPWENSVLLSGDGVASIARLKAEDGPDLVVLGSGVLVRSLLKHNLVDHLSLSIHPLVLGGGTRLFPPSGPYATLRLVDSRTTSTGVLLTQYEPT